MPPSFDFDTACALSKGQRPYQEDAIITDFARGAGVGLAVLSDGMGGHAAGDIASKIVVTEVFSELLFERHDDRDFEIGVRGTLHDAAMAANTCLKHHMDVNPDTKGMGATLVATVIIDTRLYWISIGDSPLFLFREGKLLQLNEDHSMAPQIDFMAKSGLMERDEAEAHPDRNTLTSVLFGAQIPKIDCPDDPVLLQDRDLLIVASDGLQYLSDLQLEATLKRNQFKSSSDIADTLMEEVMSLGDPDLDNVSFSIIKMRDTDRTGAKRNEETASPGFRCVG
ncbi:MAG: protein phosphatase 2C domain-containing protein [Pseudomonadota bacterium]